MLSLSVLFLDVTCFFDIKVLISQDKPQEII